MVNKPKNKGTRNETHIVNWLNNHGFPHAKRIPLTGHHDEGDITLTPHPYRIIIQAKDVATATTGQATPHLLTQWMNATHTQAHNAHATLYALVIKRKLSANPAIYYAYTHHQNLLDALDSGITAPNPTAIINTTLQDLTTIYRHWLERHPQ